MLTDYELYKPTTHITLSDVQTMMQNELCIKILRGLSIIKDASDVEFIFDDDGYVVDAYLPHVFGPDKMYNIYGTTEYDEEYGISDQTALIGALPCVVYGIKNVMQDLPPNTGYLCASSDIFLKYDMYIYHMYAMEVIMRSAKRNNTKTGAQGETGSSTVYNITLLVDEKPDEETRGAQGYQGYQGYQGSHNSHDNWGCLKGSRCYECNLLKRRL